MPIISSLTQEERAALQLCGITQDAQLTTIGADTLSRDLQTARESFPGVVDIPLPRLRELCARACREAEVTPIPEAAPKRNKNNDLPFGDASYTRACPPLVVAHHRRSSTAPGAKHALPMSATQEELERLEAEEISRREDVQQRTGEAASYDYNHAIHCSHPVATYLGAWATILLTVDLAAVIIIPLLIVLGFDIRIDVRGVGFYMALGGLLPYICLVSSARCSVCSVHIFSFRKYAHNRQAHWVPLLGHVLPTALHIAFLFWYRCPACGTPQKLFRGVHRHDR